MTPRPESPAELMRVGGVVVEESAEAGDYYCEHVYYLAQRAAASSHSLRANRCGEPLVGFLHVPADFSSLGGSGQAQGQRHAFTREVVGRGLRGYLDELGGEASARVLLTGFEAFGTVADNPSGDFVTQPENLDAAMAVAFGGDLLTPVGRWRSLGGDSAELEYRVRDASTGRERTIGLVTLRLPVDDTAIDGGPDSIQDAIRRHRPHAVLSLGAGHGYHVEINADAGGLGLDPMPHHDDASLAGNQRLPTNRSLSRAVAARLR